MSPKSIVVNGKTIIFEKFQCSILRYGELEGYSWDSMTAKRAWVEVVEDSPRPDRGEGETGRSVWMPIYEECSS